MTARTRPRSWGLRAAALLCAATLTAAAQPAGPVDAATWMQQVLDAVNRYRAERGLQPVQPSDGLRELAMAHSERMARERQLTHDGFQSRFDRVDSALCVENVAAGTTRAAVLVGAWSRATMHRRNLEEPRLRRAGVAVAGAYVTFFACE